MKDKEMIEEMANLIYDNRPIKDIWNEEAEEIAKVLYNAGYRKIDENFVTKELCEYWRERALMLKQAVHDISKKTAEMFANEFYAELKEFGQGRVITYASVCEIAKKHNKTIPRETFTSIEIKE